MSFVHFTNRKMTFGWPTAGVNCWQTILVGEPHMQHEPDVFDMVLSDGDAAWAWVPGPKVHTGPKHDCNEAHVSQVNKVRLEHE
jgi:hypothetical protein